MSSIRVVPSSDPSVRLIVERLPASSLGNTAILVVEDAHGGRELMALRDLEWDTRVLGMKTGRIVDVVDGGTRVSDYANLADFLRQRGFGYVTIRRPVAEWSRLRALESAGFRFVDGILSFEKNLGSTTRPGSQVRPVKPSDVETLVGVAELAFVKSRFHNDDAIPAGVADRLHAEWVRNSCAGQAAEAVLVAEDGGQAAGFITCKTSNEVGRGRVGTIELVAVSPRSAGKGLGRALIDGSLEWFAGAGCVAVHVQTQIDNFPAMKLYIATGFTPTSTFATLRWAK